MKMPQRCRGTRSKAGSTERIKLVVCMPMSPGILMRRWKGPPQEVVQNCIQYPAPPKKALQIKIQTNMYSMFVKFSLASSLHTCCMDHHGGWVCTEMEPATEKKQERGWCAARAKRSQSRRLFGGRVGFCSRRSLMLAPVAVARAGCWPSRRSRRLLALAQVVGNRAGW